MKTTRLGQKKRDAKEAMGTPNQQGTVAFIKADLITRGIIPDPQTSNDHSVQITARVAWATRDQGAWLIRKSAAQNGAWLTIRGERVKVSHDAIAYPDGWVDCLVGAGPPQNTNGPTWQWHPTGPPTLDTVIAPVDLDAGVPTPGPPSPPPRPDPDLPTLPELALAVTLLAEDIRGLRQDLAKLNDVLELDMQSLGTSLVRIEDMQKLGLGGSVFGARIRLVP